MENLIAEMKNHYESDKFHFDFKMSMFLSGDRNKKKRKAIVKYITGEDKPISKCGLYQVTDLLKAYFEQYKLF